MFIVFSTKQIDQVYTVGRSIDAAGLHGYTMSCLCIAYNLLDAL